MDHYPKLGKYTVSAVNYCLVMSADVWKSCLLKRPQKPFGFEHELIDIFPSVEQNMKAL